VRGVAETVRLAIVTEMAEAEVDQIAQVRPRAVAEILVNTGIEISSASLKFPTATSMPLNYSRPGYWCC
jgi:hypothetical protein